jgi:ketosteroid isomerase-like protein
MTRGSQENSMPSRWFAAPLALATLALAACAGAPVAADAGLRAQVFEAEKAFAGTMARRDFPAFKAFLADETIFFGGKGPMRGKDAVAEAWKRFFEGAQAPFSWEPAQVEVLDSGTLALTSGPVRNPDGQLIGTFTSIWRQEAPGQWRIVFDKGCEPCDCAKRS